MPMNFGDKEVSFEIVEEIGVLATHSTGWTKEINMVRWNNGSARYDIRDWDPKHERISKGITLQEREMRNLIDSLKRRRTNFKMNKSDTDVPEEPLPELEAAGEADDGTF